MIDSVHLLWLIDCHVCVRECSNHQCWQLYFIKKFALLIACDEFLHGVRYAAEQVLQYQSQIMTMLVPFHVRTAVRQCHRIFWHVLCCWYALSSLHRPLANQHPRKSHKAEPAASARLWNKMYAASTPRSECVDLLHNAWFNTGSADIVCAGQSLGLERMSHGVIIAPLTEIYSQHNIASFMWALELWHWKVDWQLRCWRMLPSYCACTFCLRVRDCCFLTWSHTCLECPSNMRIRLSKSMYTKDVHSHSNKHFLQCAAVGKWPNLAWQWTACLFVDTPADYPHAQ